jgi:hypothetical protein
MKFRRLKPEYQIKISIAVVAFVFLWVTIATRGHLVSYFSTRCLDYKQKDYSRRLNDRIVDYSVQAKMRGIEACNDEKDLRKRISEGKLVRVRTGSLYIVDRMNFSSPYVTNDSRILLDEIARRYREKTSRKGLYGVRFYITSMTRKKDNLKILRRYNSNSSVKSPHLYGNAFDISYKRFSVRKMILTNCDQKFLKDALAEVICELRDEKRCWATYERMQNCYHVVSR